MQKLFQMLQEHAYSGDHAHSQRTKPSWHQTVILNQACLDQSSKTIQIWYLWFRVSLNRTVQNHGILLDNTRVLVNLLLDVRRCQYSNYKTSFRLSSKVLRYTWIAARISSARGEFESWQTEELVSYIFRTHTYLPAFNIISVSPRGLKIMFLISSIGRPPRIQLQKIVMQNN